MPTFRVTYRTADRTLHSLTVEAPTFGKALASLGPLWEDVVAVTMRCTGKRPDGTRCHRWTDWAKTEFAGEDRCDTHRWTD